MLKNNSLANTEKSSKIELQFICQLCRFLLLIWQIIVLAFGQNYLTWDFLNILLCYTFCDNDIYIWHSI